MSVQEPSAPAPPPSTIAPAQERAPSPSSSLGDPLPTKKIGSKKKQSKRKTSKRAKTVEPVDPPAPKRPRNRYEPYRRAEPTPEREAALPADPEELETLDATAKKLYKSDREVLEYVEALKRRTAAMLEHVNRADSQLRACKGAMGRIGLYMGHWQKMEDRWTHQELFGSGNFRARWVDGKMEVLDSEESSDDDDDTTPNPDLFPTLTRDERGAFPTIEEHLSKNVDHPDFPHDYAQKILGESAPRPSNNDSEDEDFSRPETPPARQPSLPPGHEDENALEYVEDEIEIRSDFPAPPDHASLPSDAPVFDRSEVNLRVASDTDVPYPRLGEEHANLSKRFKREAMDFTSALAVRPQNDPPRLRHPLAQSYVPSSPDPASRPEPHHLVVPQPVPHTPSPPRTVLAGKRKRAPTPEEEEHNDTGNVAGPSTANVFPAVGAPSQVEARNNEDRVSLKRRRLISRQPSWDFQMFVNAGFDPAPPRVDPPTRENSPEPSSQPAHRQASPPPIPTSQVQKEDSEIERSQVIEMLSQEVEQGESEDEESTENILGGIGKSRRSLPALTADNTQSTTGVNTQSEVGTPAESQLPAEVPVPIPEDVFGPVVLSVGTKRISGTFEKDDDGDSIMSDSGRANVSSKSTRFSFDGKVEKEAHKVFPKTPIRPRASLRAIEAERALAVEAEAESQDMLKPLQSPKKKRTIGARARKPKSTTSVEAEPTANPDSGLPSASTGKPPSKLRRGKSTSVQPEVPALPKTPARRSARNRK